MKRTGFLMFALLLAMLSLLPASAASCAVDDRAGLLEDPEAFLQLAEDTNARYGVSLFLLTDTTPDYLSDREVLSRCGIAEKDDAAVLLVRQYNGIYYYDMYTFGEAQTAFSNRDIDNILDDPEVYNNLKGGNIGKGVLSWQTLVRQGIAEYREAEEIRAATRMPRGIAVILVVFLLSGGVAVLSVCLCYRKKVHGETYPLERYARLHLTCQRDRFVGSFVTRVRVNDNASGFSGRGGGCGGGGHRGGR